jgi:hypothetical protein
MGESLFHDIHNPADKMPLIKAMAMPISGKGFFAR